MITIITVTTNTFPLLLLSLLPTIAFFFESSANQNHCNRLRLEKCFETAFQVFSHFHSLITMRIRRHVENDYIQPPQASKIRDRRSLRSVTHVMMPKNQHLCAANRHYLSCFNNDECQDEYAAHVASTVFNQIHGRTLPIQMFLAHRGYAVRV
uniref:Secreted protein n=1 Tax=Elaeophora elaphi TaxID=1147741 RepID=A0A0R3S6T5_9BILA